MELDVNFYDTTISDPRSNSTVTLFTDTWSRFDQAKYRVEEGVRISFRSPWQTQSKPLSAIDIDQWK